jgi:aspartyl-tRNA(Asn)/glutamyl-tRNA(Gln) amidotransferase subunit A
MSVVETVADLRGGASVEDHVAACVEAAEADDANAWASLDPAAARERARGLDGRPAGEREGPLYGLTVSVKDNLAVAGRPLTCASDALEGYEAPYTATVVDRLREAGAVVVGKGNMDEFGCGSSGETSAHGPTENPRAPGRVPGGSSSGAGAALADEQVDVALGSDTGGSTRCPAAFCGVTALKPSYGLVSRAGLVDLAMSLESPAPMARAGDTRALARLLEAVAGEDPADPVTAGAEAPDAAGGLDDLDPADLTVGLAPDFLEPAREEVTEAVRGAVDGFVSAGARRVDVSVPSLEHALPAYYVLVYSEFASAMQKFDGLRYGVRGEADEVDEAMADARAHLGDEVKRRILLGTWSTTRDHRDRWHATARRARAAIRRDFAEALEACDVLLAPTMPVPPFERGSRLDDPLEMYAADLLTVSANLAGIPAGSVPVEGADPPVGLQVLGPQGADADVLRIMRLHERLQGGPA